MNSVPTLVRIDAQVTLTRPQKLFNSLIKKIDKERKLLEAWQTTIPLYQQKQANEFAPQVKKHNELRTKLVHLFDQACPNKIFTKKERAALQDLICQIAGDLLDDNDDDELKRIYNKHSGSDFDAEIEEEKDAMKAAMETMLDMDLDDDIDFNSPEKLMAHLHEKMQEKLKSEAQFEQERLKERKKTARELAKEAKEQEELQNISKSIRDVYRKLASCLHPDREQDETERNRKTALMQRVNTAYDSRNLLKLLELQLEVEQIDQATINTMTEERLTHYNLILTEQLAELRDEISALRFMLSMRFTIPPDTVSTPVKLMKELEITINNIKHDINELNEDLSLFQDSKEIKRYVRSSLMQSAPYSEQDIFDDIDAFMYAK